MFLCLYLFLIGISGLSKSISGLTSPENLTKNDMVQVNEISIVDANDKPVTMKKVWVKIIKLS